VKNIKTPSEIISSSFPSVTTSLVQSDSKTDFEIFFTLLFSLKSNFLLSITSGRSRLYQVIFPLSTLSNLVSNPQPIETITQSGYLSINFLTSSSIIYALANIP